MKRTPTVLAISLCLLFSLWAICREERKISTIDQVRKRAVEVGLHEVRDGIVIYYVRDPEGFTPPTFVGNLESLSGVIRISPEPIPDHATEPRLPRGVRVDDHLISGDVELIRQVLTP